MKRSALALRALVAAVATAPARTLAVTMMLAALPSASAGAEPAAEPAPAVDHHMHIQSAAISRVMRQLNDAMPEASEGISDEVFTVRTGADALRELDRAGIRQGVLLSTAYMFASPLIGMEPAELARKTRQENRYNVDAALASGGRLVAMVGINPLASNALDELAYWSRRKGASGVKIHLGNAGFDPRSKAQVAKLAAFFGAARKADMPIVIHSRAMLHFDAADVATFIEQVLSQAGDLPVQIAHGGGYGGVDQPTLDALAAFGAAITRNAPGTKNLVFDISTVALFDLFDGKNPQGRSDYIAAYVAQMRKIGLDRFVLASDWPGLHSPSRYFAIERAQLPVTAAEWARLCANKAPYLDPSWIGARR